MQQSGKEQRRARNAEFATMAKQLYKKGLEFVRQGDHDAALEYFVKALKLYPLFPEALRAMVRIFKARGEERRVLKYSNKAAEAYARMGRVQEAKDLFREIRKNDASAPNPFISVARTLRKKEKYVKALRAYKLAHECTPYDADLAYEWAEACMRCGEEDLAVRLTRTTLEKGGDQEKGMRLYEKLTGEQWYNTAAPAPGSAVAPAAAATAAPEVVVPPVTVPEGAKAEEPAPNLGLGSLFDDDDADVELAESIELTVQEVQENLLIMANHAKKEGVQASSPPQSVKPPAAMRKPEAAEADEGFEFEAASDVPPTSGDESASRTMQTDHPSMFSEKRRAPRVPLADFMLELGKNKKHFPVVDISVSGIGFKDLGDVFSQGNIITFNLLNFDELASKKVAAEVRHVTDGIVGCQFTSLTKKQKKQLQSIMEKEQSPNDFVIDMDADFNFDTW